MPLSFNFQLWKCKFGPATWVLLLVLETKTDCHDDNAQRSPSQARKRSLNRGLTALSFRNILITH